MVDRTKDELREFLNSQLHLDPKDRDWTLTEGEQHILVVGLKVHMLKADKIADADERIKKTQQLFYWVGLLTSYCPGLAKYLGENKRKIFDDADEILKKAEEAQTAEVQ